MNFLDLFAQRLREKREQKKITQRELAERLNMCTRTVIEIEKCKSNPKFETVALISEEMDISLDGIVFHDRAPQTVAKCVVDYATTGRQHRRTSSDKLATAFPCSGRPRLHQRPQARRQDTSLYRVSWPLQ